VKLFKRSPAEFRKLPLPEWGDTPEACLRAVHRWALTGSIYQGTPSLLAEHLPLPLRGKPFRYRAGSPGKYDDNGFLVEGDCDVWALWVCDHARRKLGLTNQQVRVADRQGKWHSVGEVTLSNRDWSTRTTKKICKVTYVLDVGRPPGNVPIHDVIYIGDWRRVKA
jgi:hypothetical protein